MLKTCQDFVRLMSEIVEPEHIFVSISPSLRSQMCSREWSRATAPDAASSRASLHVRQGVADKFRMEGTRAYATVRRADRSVNHVLLLMMVLTLCIALVLFHTLHRR